MIVDPELKPVTSPVEFTAATDGLKLDHATFALVTSLSFLLYTIAVNCTVPPTGKRDDGGWRTSGSDA